MDDADPAETDTNHPPVASTSSRPLGESPPDDLVTELGERILVELKQDRTNNTLTRWLAHHIASLIEAADRARTCDAPDADHHAAAARTAILQLWDHRSSWPHGWPPTRAAVMVRLLDSLPDHDSTPWRSATRFSHLHDLHHRILAVICDLAIADAENLEQGWLDKFGEVLTAAELSVLTRAATVPPRMDLLERWSTNTAEEDSLGDSPTTEAHPQLTTAPSPSLQHSQRSSDHPLIALADAYHEAILTLLRASDLKSSGSGGRQRLAE